MSNTAKNTKRQTQKKVEPKGQRAKPSRIASLFDYFEKARVELGKVSWPTRKEVKTTTIAVLALVAIMSIFLGLVDLILSSVVQSILSLSI